MTDDYCADIGEEFDLIRVADHEQARKLFLACLDYAFHEGRTLVLERRIRKELGRPDATSEDIARAAIALARALNKTNGKPQ